MEDDKMIVILITTGTDKEAQRIADVLLKHRRAACVNIVPTVSSWFWWEGKIESDRECLLIVKTKASALEELVSLVREVHSYDVPEIIALPILGGNPDYLDWIAKEVK
jgi:periplasmic divalent cation tolerance protein